MFGWFKQKQKVKIVQVKGRYDAAQTNDENSNHWTAADTLSPDKANTASVRKTLRQRARYEVANNSYSKGMQLTFANDIVGSTGAKLQLRSQNELANAEIEKAWVNWCAAVNLSDKLRVLTAALIDTGEAFGLIVKDSAGKVGLSIFEADQCYSPTADLSSSDPTKAVDGLTLDTVGNPVAYWLDDIHPGASIATSGPKKYQAGQVVHLFRPDRPGQHRGIPWITPALSAMGQLRRYTLAVLAAAESAADIAGIIHSEAPAGSDAADIEPLDAIDYQRRMLMTLPAGWNVTQLKAEQPTTTYGVFKKEILAEISRCLNMPYIVAAGDSSDANYASGRLDYQVYYRAIEVERSRIEIQVLEKIFATWIEIAVREIQNPGAKNLAGMTHEWIWEGREHVDPLKEANAQQVRLASGTTTLALESAKQGLDWRDVLRQNAEELKAKQELGMVAKGEEGKSALLGMVGGITGALAIIQAFSSGQIARDSAVAQLKLFFGLTDPEAEALVGTTQPGSAPVKPIPGGTP